jgi:tetratricopeptide (TPR) repeat protein
VLALVALGLCRVPLFGVLGFEFSFVMALLASLAGADLGSTLVRRARARSVPALQRSLETRRAIAHLLLGVAAIVTAALILPVLIVSLNAVWVRNCDWWFGIECYLFLPLLSGSLAGWMGALCALAVPERRRLAALLPFAVLALSVLLSLIHFYRSPAVFSYNPFAGYFPGNLYDEDIDLRAPFYWARLFQLVCVAAGCALLGLLLDVPGLRLCRAPRPQRSRRSPGLALALSLGGALWLWHHSGALGFSVSVDDVEEALSGRYESEHFILRFPPDQQTARDAPLIAEDHEFRRAQLVRDFGVDPPGKITSFYFDSAEQKFRLMGARNVYMAKPWRNEVYINQQAFPHPVLRHEIGHVMAGSFGDPWFHVAARRLLGIPLFFNVGLIEGIAVAGDWPDHFDKVLTPHQSVKALGSLGMRPPVERLFSPGFLEFSSARSYTVAGSYLRFLIDRFGIDRVKVLYHSGGDFESAFGRSQTQVSAEWQQLIDETEVPEEAILAIEERFRSPGIFKRPCPHALARARRRMAHQQGLGHLADAIETARQTCKDTGNDPRYLLMLASLLSRQDDPSEARKIYLDIADADEHISASLRAMALFELVDLAMHSGQTDDADALLERLEAMPLDDNSRRRAVVEREVLHHSGPAGRALRDIFWGPRLGELLDPVVVVGLAAEAAALEPESALAHYLIGRQLTNRNDPDAACRSLLRALGGQLHPLVERESARLLAIAAYRAGRYDDVIRAAAILVRADQPQVTRLSGYDWLERVQWKRSGSLSPEPLGWDGREARSGLPAGFR